MNHFIDSLRDEVRIVKRVPKKFSRKYGYSTIEMPPVSWSTEKYYLEQVCWFYQLNLRLYILHNWASYLQFKV